MVLLLSLLSFLPCEYTVPSFLSILAFLAISSCISYCNVSVAILLTTAGCWGQCFFSFVGSSAPCPRCTPGMRSYTQVTVAQFLYIPKRYVTVRANNGRFSSQIVTKSSLLKFPNCTTFSLIWDIMIPIVWFLHVCWQEIDGLLLPSQGTFR